MRLRWVVFLGGMGVAWGWHLWSGWRSFASFITCIICQRKVSWESIAVYVAAVASNASVGLWQLSSVKLFEKFVVVVCMSPLATKASKWWPSIMCISLSRLKIANIELSLVRYLHFFNNYVFFTHKKDEYSVGGLVYFL